MALYYDAPETRGGATTAEPSGEPEHPDQAEVLVPTPGLPAPPKNLSVEQERQLRKQELTAAFRLFGKFGFGEGVAGHMTARDPGDPDLFWVNPFTKSFKQIRVSDLIQVNHQGEVVQGHGVVNKAGFFIHSEVHKARPDVVSAAHTHSIHGRALASLGQNLLTINQDSSAFHNDIALYDYYGGPAGYRDEGIRIAQALGPRKAAVLLNHGLITVGHSVSETAWWFISLERCAQVQLLASAVGKPVELEKDIAEYAYKETGSHFAGWLSFRPLWDEIVAEQPDLLD